MFLGRAHNNAPSVCPLRRADRGDFCARRADVRSPRVVTDPNCRYDQTRGIRTEIHGGISGWQKVHREIRDLLRDNSACVTTMLDLYALPNDFPGFTSVEIKDPRVRATEVESAMREVFAAGEKFRPYVQVHEFEALIFAGPEVAAQRADDERVGIAIEEAVRQAGEPELVNDNPSTAPSKRLKAVWPGYVKTLDGVNIASAIGLNRLRSTCPHFGSWIDWLESL